MVILGVDYGDVRTGISVCDKYEMMASPVCTIEQRNTDELIDEIIKLIDKYNAELLVIGVPKNMDSSLGIRAEKCIEFANKLTGKSNIPHILRDERLTTVSALQSLNATNTRGEKRKKAVDQLSAVIILQDYLDFKKNQPKEGK